MTESIVIVMVVNRWKNDIVSNCIKVWNRCNVSINVEFVEKKDG